MDSEEKNHYHRKSTLFVKGKNKVVDERKKGDGLNLNKVKYEMYSCSFDVLIDKRDGLKVDSFDHLRSFQHDNALPLLDFYIQGKTGRIVTPKVRSSFQAWFNNGGKTRLFDERGHMTPIFEKLIIEYCDLIESLFKQDLVLEKFDIDNMFVNIFDGVPTLCVLLTEVKKVPCMDALHRQLTWDCPRKFISWCEDQCHITRDSLTEKFCAFLGDRNFNVKKLRYPHNWDDATKGEYLLSLVASDHSHIRSLLRGSGLTWPQRSNNRPELLQSILTWEKQRGREYNVSDFFNYVILLRNCYKHHEHLPKDIKAVLTNLRALIEHIEMWTPNFWIELYERIGWPSYFF